MYLTGQIDRGTCLVSQGGGTLFSDKNEAIMVGERSVKFVALTEISLEKLGAR